MQQVPYTLSHLPSVLRSYFNYVYTCAEGYYVHDCSAWQREKTVLGSLELEFRVVVVLGDDSGPVQEQCARLLTSKPFLQPLVIVRQGVVVHTFKQPYFYEFKVSLVYTVQSMPATLQSKTLCLKKKCILAACTIICSIIPSYIYKLFTKMIYAFSISV